MSRRNEHLYSLNAGGVDPEATARIDLEKLRLAAEHPMANLLPRVLGPAGLRPGSESLARIPSDAQTRLIRFVRAIGSSYLLLLSPGEMRVMSGGVIQQVPTVATTIASGSWTDASTAPATATGGASPSLTATRTSLARLRQTVSVSSGQSGTTHVLRIVVSSGPVVLRVGQTSGGEEVLTGQTLDTGTHKIGFVPGATTIYVELESSDDVARTISQIQFESTLLGGTGDLVLPTPWSTWARVRALRTDQSVDVLFCGDGTQQQRRIEHRGPLAWSVALYKSRNGPWVTGSDRIGMSASGLTGNVAITSSENYFKTGHVGALIELTSTGKAVSATLNGAAQTTDYVTVVGLNRGFEIQGVASGFTGRVVLERSFDAGEPVNWSETSFAYVDGAATTGSVVVQDGFTNLTVHYRWKMTARTAGSVALSMWYAGDTQIGRARITGYNGPTQVFADVIEPFGSIGGVTRNWRIGDWSDVRGWPRTPRLHDGRLLWFRQDVNYGSVVDDFSNFDDSVEGDSAPFTRSVGTAGQDGVLWALSMGKLLVGTAAFEAVIAASEMDEPLTPTRYTVRKPSRRGCLDAEAAEHDDGAFFVQRSGRRLYEISAADGARFASQDMTRLNPAAYKIGIVATAVQQQPDTRHWAALSDGSLVALTFDRADKVAAVTTAAIAGGLVEDVAVLAETDQDDVYLLVNRSGSRWVERLGKEAAQSAVTTCTLLDAYRVLTGTVTQITGATHLAGQTVQVWADGARRADVTLNGSGVAALGATYARVVYGRRYYGSFKSVKLALAAQIGTAIGQTKTVHGAGVLLVNACLDGVRIGRDVANTDPLPAIVNGAARTASQLFAAYDQEVVPINADWDPDARVYLQVDSAEGPCTIQGIVLDIETRDGAGAGN